MIKSKATVIGTVTRSADIKNGRDGQPFITFGMRVRLGDGDDAADIDISVAYDGEDEDVLFTNKDDRVKVQSVMTFKKMGDTTYYNLSAEKVKHDVAEDDAINGTLEFKGTLGAKGVVQHLGKKGAFRHFDAYSAEKVGEDQYSYIWVHFVDFGDDQCVWMGPKTKIKAHKQLTEHTLGVVPDVLDGEEREQDRQTEDLLGREFAVLGFGKPRLPLGNLNMVHHVHHSLNRFRIITFREKAADFRNNVPIFVHAKGIYVSLFGDTNIVIINEICNISQRNQP